MSAPTFACNKCGKAMTKEEGEAFTICEACWSAPKRDYKARMLEGIPRPGLRRLERDADTSPKTPVYDPTVPEEVRRESEAYLVSFGCDPRDARGHKE